MNISIQYLQEYIKLKDYNPNDKDQYFFKLTEEVGELARAMRKNLRSSVDGQIKETIEEELWDVIYYAIAIANTYDIDLGEVIPAKEKLNNEKYKHEIEFGDKI